MKVRTFCSSTAKTSTVIPIFYFMILIRTVLPFDEKKIGTNLCSVINCTDWAITGQIALLQFNSTLDRKEKTKALKGIFLVCKWINNRESQILCDTTRVIKKISPFCLVLGCARFLSKGPNSRICQHFDVKTSRVNPTFYYFFIILLTCYISVPSFIYNLC